MSEVKVIDKVFMENRLDEFLLINRENVDQRMQWTTEQFLMEVEEKWNLSLALMDQDEILGFIIASKKTDQRAHVNQLMVSSKHRNKKLGTNLMNRFHERITSEGYQESSLWVYSNLPNVISFYEALGYAKSGERINQESENLSIFVRVLNSQK